MAGLLRLARPLNAVMSGIGVFVGGVVAVGTDAWGRDVLPLVLAALAAVSFTAGGNALNDLFDRETDKINHPDRPLPSGSLTVRAAQAFTISTFLAAGLLAVLINPYALAVVVLNAIAMYSYERNLKARGASGNLVISYLVGSLFLFAGVAVFRNDFVVLERTVILGLLAGLTTLGREITKDSEDMAGDVDRRTLPQRIGAEAAGRVAAVALIAGVALSALPIVLGVLHWTYIVLVVPADGMFIYAALHSAAHPARSQRVTKYAMILALLAFLVGGLL
jgi:geranylgeranylglycerol-phosphate geranylgeranyltransferase